MTQTNKGTQNLQQLSLIYAGEIAVTKPAGEVWNAKSFYHGLGYNPAYFAYAKWRILDGVNDKFGSRYQLPYIQSVATGADAGKQQWRLDCTASEQSIGCFTITDQLPNDTYYFDNELEVVFYLYILREQLK